MYIYIYIYIYIYLDGEGGRRREGGGGGEGGRLRDGEAAAADRRGPGDGPLEPGQRPPEDCGSAVGEAPQRRRPAGRGAPAEAQPRLLKQRRCRLRRAPGEAAGQLHAGGQPPEAPRQREVASRPPARGRGADGGPARGRRDLFTIIIIVLVSTSISISIKSSSISISSSSIRVSSSSSSSSSSRSSIDNTMIVVVVV